MRESCKPAVSYGWDWHPRLIPSGLWDEVNIQIIKKMVIENADVSYRLNDEMTSVVVKVELDVNIKGRVRLDLVDRNGEVQTSIEHEIASGRQTVYLSKDNPKLWWPVGFGEQNLYQLRISCLFCTELCDTKVVNIGFRKSELVMNEGSWEKLKVFPKSQNTHPITLQINDRRLFAKGSNWVNPEIFPGIITEETYRELITLARDANMNIFRIWGGGIVNKESFYDICDELGIMVWQEFPLACNEYPNKEKYLKVLEQEATSIIKRLRNHPCLVMWCGGNELFNSWSKMTEQHYALRLLNSLCYQHDQNTPFLMTSPVYGMVHGHYLNVDTDGVEIITQIVSEKNTAYTEFGCPGPSPATYIQKFMSQEEYENCKETEVWQAHHAFGSWCPKDTWLRLSEAEYFFGGYSTTDDLIEKLTFVQSMSYRSMYEEMRKQWPFCSMAIGWCFNEPWPTAANNSIINWPANPKKAYEAVKLALRDQMASLRVQKHLYHYGEEFSAEVWLLNDSITPLASGVLQAYIVQDGQIEELFSWEFKEVSPQSNLKGPSINKILSYIKNNKFEIILKISERPQQSSEYIYLLKQNQTINQKIILNI